MIEEAEKDIDYVFKNVIKLLKEKKDLIPIVIFFNKDLIAEGFVRKGEMDENLFQQQIQNVGKDIKPKLTAMVGNGQMTIAHHLSKITSNFIENENGWEEIW